MRQSEPNDQVPSPPSENEGAISSVEVAEAEVMVINEAGLHLRVAMRIVEVATKLAAAIEVHTEETRANAKSMLDLLALAAGPGTKLRFAASGREAADSLKRLLASLSPEEFEVLAAG